MRRFCVVLFLLGLAIPTFGQSNYAVLTGTVTDPQHLPVAGAAGLGASSEPAWGPAGAGAAHTSRATRVHGSRGARVLS